MKKLVIIIIVLLLLAGAGGGAYYYFFMMEDDLVIDVGETVPEPVKKVKPAEPIAVAEPNMDYFVLPGRLNVRAYPRKDAHVRAMLRKGMQIKALEVKGEWVRISEYEVHPSGNDTADWVHTGFLSHDEPQITQEEMRKIMFALVKKSDDIVQYEEQFIAAAKQLIDEGTCSYEDFELMGGWVRSRTFNIEPVYFIYCDGTERENKVYLNMETGETFQP